MSYRAYTLNKASMAGRLDRAPLEKSRAARRGRTVMVSVPAPTGELIDFAVVESPIMQRRLQTKHPDITDVRRHARSPTGYTASIRLDLTPNGFHASVRDGQPRGTSTPPTWGDDSLYLSYYGAALPAPERGLVEPKLDEKLAAKVERRRVPADREAAGAVVMQRVYRLALVTDRSYAEYVAPGLNDGTQDARRTPRSSPRRRR